MTAAAAAAVTPTVMVGHNAGAGCQTAPTDGVGRPLTDEGREEAIKRAGRALEAHYFRWCCTGNFADKGDADRARLLMEALIRGRSKGQVLALEIKRGLI